VMLHRDPLKVLASVARLTEILRRPFTRHVVRSAIGDEVSARWTEGIERMIAAHSEYRNILHLHFRDVVTAPMNAVAALYRHCGMTLSAAAEARMASYLRKAQRGGYAMHTHSLEAFGLDAAELNDRFRRYRDVFDVEPESRHAAPGIALLASPT
ncbi:MAG: sulfotransferase, partial [Gammaproteobacteria bacterium]|nr:sulfotransferase [Gammaproteobacteria bacterium]